MKILIVDDEPGGRSVLKRTVEHHGHEVIEAGDGQEGLRMASQHKPDAIISDALMPNMDGFQFLRAVRLDETLSSIPFVLYTAIYTGEKEYELALSLGADALLAKPKAPEDFWKEFTSALEAHASQKKQAPQTRPAGREEDNLRDYCRMVAARLEEKVRELETVISAHERTKSILQESEERYRLMFENNPHPMWVYDLETLAFLAVNNAAIHKYGYSREEFLSMTIKDIRPEEDIPALLDKVSKVSEGLDEAGIWRHLKKDGTIIEVEITSHPMSFAGRRAELILAHDVTERRRIEAELKTSEEKYRDLFENANDAIFILDADLCYLDVNNKAVELTGYSKDELLNLCVFDMIPNEQIARSDAEFSKLKTFGSYEKFGGKLRRKDGSYMDIEVSSSAIIKDGKVAGSRDIVRDITKRRKMEEAVERQKQFTDSLIQNSAVATFVLDAQHNVLLWNRACEELTGLPASEMLGTTDQWRPFYDHQRPVLADIVMSSAPGSLLSIYSTYSKSVLTSDGLHAEGWYGNLNGRDRYLVFDAAPIFDPEGEVIAAIETLQDITERKRAEEQILLAKQDWEETFNTITDMVTVHDKDYNIVRANKAAEKILGLPLLDMNKKIKCFDYYHGTGCPPEGCPSCQSLITGKPSTSEFYEPHLKMFLEINAIPRLDGNNQSIGLIHVVRDITERKKTEEALERYSKELTSLNTASDTLMLITNLDDIYREICDVIYSVFEMRMVWLGIVEEESFEVKPVAYAGFEDGYLSNIRVTWDDSPTGMGPTGMSIKDHAVFKTDINDPLFSPWRLEARNRGYVASVAVPLIYARDKCIGALNFYSDDPDYFTPDRIKLFQIFANQAAIAIENARLVSGLETEVHRRTRALEDTNTELQQLNRELELRREEAEAASRSKTDFLANMSHELRTPLNAIMGFSEIMQTGMAGPLTDKQKEFLGDIYTSGEHLLALIKDILDLSKIEAGKTVLEPGTFSLRELIDSSLMMFKEKALKHAIKVTTEIDNTITGITADQRKLKQVLVNLLSNAFKFTPDGGSVRVSVRRVRGQGTKIEGQAARGKGQREEGMSLLRAPMTLDPDGDFIEISVSDTGIGISEEHMQRLFQPFQQIDTSLTRKYGGTGLGLSLCRRFVELHGGRIWAESQGGKGSRFTFIIPVRQQSVNGEK